MKGSLGRGDEEFRIKPLSGTHVQLDHGASKIDHKWVSMVFKEDIEKEDIVYRQMDSHTEDGRVSHKHDWSLTSRVKNAFYGKSLVTF